MTSAAPTANSALATRHAVKAMQIKLGLPADSYPTPELIARLRGAQLPHIVHISTVGLRLETRDRFVWWI